MNSLRYILTGRVTTADRERSHYRYVPFDLPWAASLVHVRYRYTSPMCASQAAGGNVLDIGLFDPRGAAFPGGAGFRGWSGSAREEFTVALHDATPGYLPGPLPAGRYYIILGLYRIQPDGADYTIDVSAEFDQVAAVTYKNADPEMPHQQVRSRGIQRFWLQGDLHSHTDHSDARGTLKQLVERARTLGFDFLAITDHNTVSHHAHLESLSSGDLMLIPGQESTSYYGHMNIWRASRWCDFRCCTDREMAQVISLAHESGGVCSINHPKTGGPPWEYGDDLPVDVMEIWQGPWPLGNVESVTHWDRLLLGGRRLSGVGGSDYHCPAGEEVGFRRLGQPTTWVKVSERSIGAVLDAIHNGRVCISFMPNGPRLDLRARAGNMIANMGDTLTVERNESVMIEIDVEQGMGWTLQLIADGSVVHEVVVTELSAVVRWTVAARQYVRAELVGDAPAGHVPPRAAADLNVRAWRWALSNPVYIRRRACISPTKARLNKL